TVEEINTIADLETREVLLAKLAGALKAKTSQAASLFQAPLSKTARLAAALQEKAEKDPSVLAGGAGTPAPAEDSSPADTAGAESQPEAAAAAAAETTEGSTDD